MAYLIYDSVTERIVEELIFSEGSVHITWNEAEVNNFVKYTDDEVFETGEFIEDILNSYGVRLYERKPLSGINRRAKTYSKEEIDAWLLVYVKYHDDSGIWDIDWTDFMTIGEYRQDYYQ